MTGREDFKGRGRCFQGFALAVVFSLELLVFCVAVHRHYTWIFPRWYDQDQYLIQSYDAYEAARAHGFAAGAAMALGQQSPQGALHAFLSLLVFEVVGPSRLAALSLNLLGLVALQLASFCAVSRLSRSSHLGWAAVAALAALGGPWTGLWGSAADFRLDWMAACAFGVALSIGLLGRGFRSTPMAILFGAAVGVALMVRFLTVVYFGGILVLLAGWLLIEPDRLRRCGRLGLSALAAAAVSGWSFWRCRHLIYAYYWVGHYDSLESNARRTHEDTLGSLAWMANGIAHRQVDIGCGCICLGVLCCFWFARRGRKTGPEDTRVEQTGLRDSWVMAAIFFSVPTFVLLTHPEKADPPTEIIVPAFMWLVFLAWISLVEKVPAIVVRRTCAAAMVLGSLVFVFFQERQTVPPDLVREYRDINSLSDFLYYRAQEAAIRRPLVSVTWMSDSLNADAFRILGYERHGKMLPFIIEFPTSILEEAAPAVFARLARSDFVCLVTRSAPAWPVDRQMAAMGPDLRKWCGANMVYDGDINTPDIAASVFEKKGLGGPTNRVALAALLSLGASGPVDQVPAPPSPPYSGKMAPLLWSAGSPFHYEPKVAYSPFTLSAVELPAGVHLDGESGELHGSFEKPGDYTVRLRATNAVGSSDVVVPFRAIDLGWTAEVTPPAEVRAGKPANLDYSAFDEKGTLQFIDITDLTEGKAMARIEAAVDEHETWQGRYSFVIDRPGKHQLIARTVRYDAAKAQYTYIDQVVELNVLP